MLKALALTLMVATFLASGFTLAPAGQADAPSFTGREMLVAEDLVITPGDDHITAVSEVLPAAKSDREDKPNS